MKDVFPKITYTPRQCPTIRPPPSLPALGRGRLNLFAPRYCQHRRDVPMASSSHHQLDFIKIGEGRGGREGDTQRVLPLSLLSPHSSPPRTFSRTATLPPLPLLPTSPHRLLFRYPITLRRHHRLSGQQRGRRAEEEEEDGGRLVLLDYQ